MNVPLRLRHPSVSSSEDRILHAEEHFRCIEQTQLLRGPWDTLHFAESTEDFPLTLPLSPREREQQDRGWRLADGCCANSGKAVIARLRTILPLPKGEGRGEGEPNVAHPTVGSVTP